MIREGSIPWDTLERWSPAAFLVAGLMFLLSAAITVVDIAVGAEQLRLQLGQATVGAGWIAGLVGLLGLYPGLVDRNRWLVRAGAVFCAIGLVGYAIMTVGVLAIFAGAPEGDLAPLEPVFLPLMLAGSVLPFLLFGVASARTDVYPRGVGALLLVQVAIFVANVLTPTTPTPATVVLVVLVGLLLVNVGVGYLLRTGGGRTDREDVEASRDPSVG